ncbi:metal-dependent hydrolase [Corynebacterium liangguodongii]|uniref:Metal-dependent hydrolase n=2 Tax=Corynebacterium liangguodongii TaxID=2079535 RepID=A0A2S0WCS8_9CORY|nr:metal-dependent hydrolase [Corynebacterium liangguodongii]PWC00345.1 M48 family peptidase [Corynebacterium liangguodongii]
MWAEENVRVIRSAKRTKTVSARLVAGVLEVRIPARMSRAEERRVVEEMVGRLERKATASRLGKSDDALFARARQLNDSVLGGRASFTSIRWSSRQHTRWGSCSVATGDIRISDRLREVPDYVVDVVIVHELAHTIVPGHGPQFWELADRAPLAERAKGYLEAYQRFAR